MIGCNNTVQCSVTARTKLRSSKKREKQKGNYVWPFVLMDYVSDTKPPTPYHPVLQSPGITNLITKYKDVFEDPKTLPPQRSYDHSIPLVPRSILEKAQPGRTAKPRKK